MTNFRSERDVCDGLNTFATELHAIPEVNELPKTTLEVIDRRQREDYWNRFLRYFLDPAEPHGFGTDILEGFVEAVTDSGVDDRTDYDVHRDVTVESEVQSANGIRPDLVIYLDGKWGICVELKVTSLERANQTTEYAEAFQLDHADVDELSYVYISKQTHPDSVSPEFVDVPWSDIVSAFDDILVSGKGQYTERGVAQLRDFRDSIDNEITMSDDAFAESQREKVALYVEHYDEISEAKEAYEKLHEQEVNRWAQRFREEFRPDAWDDSWNCDPGRDGHIYRDGWRLDANGEPVAERDRAEFHIEFQHFLRWKPIFAEERLRFRAYTSRHANDDYREEFKRLCNTKYREQLVETGEPYGIDHVSGKKTHTEKYYSFDGGRVPESFYETLSEAFDENAHLAPILTEIHEEAVDRVRR